MPLVRKQPPVPAAAAPLMPGAAGLRANSADLRWQAARALGSDPAGIPILGETLATEQDTRVREAIFTALAWHGTPACADIVAVYLRSDDAALRCAALDALQAMPISAGAVLPSLLADPEPDVRLLSCEIARVLPAALAARHMCELLDRETEPNVCAVAVDVLAEVGDATALPALARCAARFSADPYLGFAIRAASGRIGTQAGPPGG